MALTPGASRRDRPPGAIGERVDPSDAVLVRRAVGGCGRSFDALIDRYDAQALRTAYGICRDMHEARDAIQDASIQAYRALGNFRLEAEFRPWFLRIVHNAALAQLRRRARRGGLVDRIRERSLEEAASSPEVHVLAAEARSSVRRALATLPRHDQDALRLRWFEDRSEAEISAALGIPRGTVKSRLSRARGRLREALERDAGRSRSEAGERPAGAFAAAPVRHSAA